jgi:hypothetical protein
VLGTGDSVGTPAKGVAVNSSAGWLSTGPFVGLTVGRSPELEQAAEKKKITVEIIRRKMAGFISLLLAGSWVNLP